jgi:hypothetical protein
MSAAAPAFSPSVLCRSANFVFGGAVRALDWLRVIRLSCCSKSNGASLSMPSCGRRRRAGPVYLQSCASRGRRFAYFQNAALAGAKAHSRSKYLRHDQSRALVQNLVLTQPQGPVVRAFPVELHQGSGQMLFSAFRFESYGQANCNHAVESDARPSSQQHCPTPGSVRLCY